MKAPPRMKKIKLTTGECAVVDDDDFDYLNRFNWQIGGGHAVRQIGTAGKNGVTLYAEFLVKQKKANDRYFFKNGNPLDLRKSNLEVRSYSNAAIGARKTKSITTSRYKGVCFDKRTGRWIAYVTKKIEGKRIKFLYKSFENEKDAAKERNRVAREVFGEFAYENKI